MDARYEILGQVGSGPTCTVFRARQHQLNREVALRQLRPELQLVQARRARFFRESEAWASQKHTALASVYDIDRGQTWIVAELLAGSAAGISTPLDNVRVRSLLHQSLTALDHLHRQNLVHANIKPTNLLDDGRGNWKLTDGRLVEAYSATVSLPRPSGACKYVAPELVDPSLGHLGPAVDLYGLGVVALELLAGRDFDLRLLGSARELDDDAVWLRWHADVKAPFPPANELVAGIDAGLAYVIDRLVCKSVESRYHRAADAIEDLRQVPALADERHASRPTPAYPQGRADGSNPGVTGTAARRPRGRAPLAPFVEIPTAPVVLRVASGIRAGESVGFHTDEVTIGTAGDCDLCLPTDSEAEALRVAVRREADGWKLSVFGSTAAFLNQRRVHGAAPLRSGDLVRLSCFGPDVQFLLVNPDDARLVELGSRFGLVPAEPQSSPARSGAPDAAAQTPELLAPPATPRQMYAPPSPPSVGDAMRFAPLPPPGARPSRATSCRPLLKRAGWCAAGVAAIVGIAALLGSSGAAPPKSNAKSSATQPAAPKAAHVSSLPPS